MNLLWNTLGWVAAVLNVWGNLALTTKGIRGWIIRIACNLCWMPYGIYTRAWALLANHLLFVGINCYGWWKWHRDELRLTARIEVPGETPPMNPIERARREGYVRGWDAAIVEKVTKCGRHGVVGCVDCRVRRLTDAYAVQGERS